jgi:small subunit ribosomal protein S21
LAEVRIFDSESIESALRRFKRQVQQEGILKEVKKHSFFPKPGEKKRLKSKLAQKLKREKVRRQPADTDSPSQVNGSPPYAAIFLSVLTKLRSNNLSSSVDCLDFASIPPTGLMSATLSGYIRDKHSNDQNPQIVMFRNQSNMHKAPQKRRCRLRICFTTNGPPMFVAAVIERRSSRTTQLIRITFRQYLPVTLSRVIISALRALALLRVDAG